ncbi:hypothetical protein FEM48_Zijuj05G0157000 [Ziziphus jujuba var. spinosa]|uniref:Uncharacterized protein n=1 Tax=Ziziphus jujuba var. spinosa TaxID=714518 RepID=A0A978VFP0_ZIZJJ|nr:hypothetical protein FEM48_Zijuj05G0157000 [Ziziphus jujuba var. spinosa]
MQGITVDEGDSLQFHLNIPTIIENGAITNEASSLESSQKPTFVNNVPQQFYNAFVLSGVIVDVNLGVSAGPASVNTETSSISDSVNTEDDVAISNGVSSTITAAQNSKWSTASLYVVLNKPAHNGNIDITIDNTQSA